MGHGRRARWRPRRRDPRRPPAAGLEPQCLSRRPVARASPEPARSGPAHRARLRPRPRRRLRPARARRDRALDPADQRVLRPGPRPVRPVGARRRHLHRRDHRPGPRRPCVGASRDDRPHGRARGRARRRHHLGLPSRRPSPTRPSGRTSAPATATSLSCCRSSGSGGSVARPGRRPTPSATVAAVGRTDAPPIGLRAMTEQTPAPAPTTQATPVAGPLTVREITRRRGRRDAPRGRRQLPADACLGPGEGRLAAHAPGLVRRLGRPRRCRPRPLAHHPAPLPVLRLPARGAGAAVGRRGDRPGGVARPARRLGQGQQGVRAAARLPRRLPHLGPRAGQEAGRRQRPAQLHAACPRPSTTRRRARLEAWLDRNHVAPARRRRGRRRSAPPALHRRPAWAAPTPSCSRG